MSFETASIAIMNSRILVERIIHTFLIVALMYVIIRSANPAFM